MNTFFLNLSAMAVKGRCFVAPMVMSAALFAAPAFAGEGHDHGEAKSDASGPAQPRFSTQSDLFDAVGILNKHELVVYVDRAGSNEPVLNASIELESTGVKAIGKFEAALGEYHFDGKSFAKDGEYPVTLTIRAGQDSDLLTADLDVHRSGAATATDTPHSAGWKTWAIWIAGGFALLAVVGFVGRRFSSMRRSRAHHTGVAL